MKDQTAETIATLYVENIICRHGAPETFLTDRGKNFMSKLIAEICRLTQTRKQFTTAYHPACDGLVENSTIRSLK